jgi:hypothetical protein
VQGPAQCPPDSVSTSGDQGDVITEIHYFLP